MTPENHRLAGDIFAQLLSLPSEQRAAFINSACGENVPLRAEVLNLLNADDAARQESFLERGGMEDVGHHLALRSPVLPAPGMLFGGYRLGRKLGAGGMGVVYEAQDLRLGRRVAFKFLPLVIAEKGTELVQRFQREARAASQLNHPNIVAIFDANFDERSCYIAMELVEGTTLRQLIASGRRMEPSTIIDILGQAASALNAAHEAGIIHRDIKPENIMVRPDGMVKVLDFGVAKVLESSAGKQERSDLRTRAGAIPGTIHYLSPEQVSDEPLSPRSDLFSLGIVGYELATGVRPFNGKSDYAVLDAIVNHVPLQPSSLCPGLGGEIDALILKALEKDPDLRFQSAGSLRSSCLRISRDYPLKPIETDSIPTNRGEGLMRGLTTFQKGKQRAPARRGLTWTIPAALVIALALAALWFGRSRPAPRVTGIVQLTGGAIKQEFVTDGTRIIYAEGVRNSEIKVFQMSAKGGDPQPMPELTGMVPLDISPDRTEIMLGKIIKDTSVPGTYPIWVADALGNALHRLTNVTGTDARWSPKGDQILYCIGTELWLARSDGTQTWRIVTAKGDVHWPSWSPDGRSIRFSVAHSRNWQLWEATAEGTQLHEVLPKWKEYTAEYGSWTPDGKYFVFSGGKGEERDLWALPHGFHFDQPGGPAPIRLTNGPMKTSSLTIAAEGKRIFFEGALEAHELVRYDGKSGNWRPYLGGLPAMQLDYSRDGKWIAYTHCPDASVYRSAVDGSQRLQLTSPPFEAVNPRWSPDGTHIAFYGHWPKEPSHVYIVPAAGGAVEQLTQGEAGSLDEGEPVWSPDGTAIISGARYSDDRTDPGRTALQIADLRTHRVSKLPGSNGLWSPRWSPDGHYVAVLGFPDRVWLYDLETHKARRLTSEPAGWPGWSRDSQYVYFKDAQNETWCRVKIKDGVVERVANTSGLTLSGVSMGWIGLDFDGTPITTRIQGGREIFVLDWERP